MLNKYCKLRILRVLLDTNNKPLDGYLGIELNLNTADYNSV